LQGFQVFIHDSRTIYVQLLITNQRPDSRCSITAGGRLFTFFVLMLGLGVVAVPTGLVASALSQARDKEISEQP